MNRTVNTEAGVFRLEVNSGGGELLAVSIADNGFYLTLPLEMYDRSDEDVASYINEVYTQQ